MGDAPIRLAFPDDDGRDRYWETCSQVINKRNALIFLDPDTGPETGKPSYLRRMGGRKIS
jgi:hypothetical protein